MAVYCPECKRHLYDFHGEVVSGAIMQVSEFTAVEATGDPQASTPMRCEYDDAPLNGYEYWFHSRGLPNPVMAYDGVTLMTKENGEFVYKPYEVNLID